MGGRRERERKKKREGKDRKQEGRRQGKKRTYVYRTSLSNVNECFLWAKLLDYTDLFPSGAKGGD